VLEKAGYQREGVMRQSAIKDGVVQEQWLYAILRHEASPRTPADSRGTPAAAFRYDRGMTDHAIHRRLHAAAGVHA